MKALLVLALGLVSPLAAIPANTTLTLVSDPNLNKVTVTVDPGFGLADTDVTTLTGTRGTVTIAPAASPSRFLRLRVTEPL